MVDESLHNYMKDDNGDMQDDECDIKDDNHDM